MVAHFGRVRTLAPRIYCSAPPCPKYLPVSVSLYSGTCSKNMDLQDKVVVSQNPAELELSGLVADDAFPS